MRSSKPITIVLVIGACALSAFCAHLGSRAATLEGAVSARATQGRVAASGRTGASRLHVSRATVRRINELLQLNGIPVVLSTSDPIAQPSQHGEAVCFASGRAALIIAGPVGDD